jgi:hypothetical protein
MQLVYVESDNSCIQYHNICCYHSYIILLGRDNKAQELLKNTKAKEKEMDLTNDERKRLRRSRNLTLIELQ